MSIDFQGERCCFCGREIQLGDLIGKKGKVQPFKASGYVHTRCLKLSVRGTSRAIWKLRASGLSFGQASKLMLHKPERN
ncbi:hypothetical protein [Singulisphaera sp. PoT]|uniref:hypothetical protein n=1 Tax=Singulisphaera sp. PoT TaxID=3411797 RepID=UPI003BF5A3CD